MKKIIFFLLLIITGSLNAQTTIGKFDKLYVKSPQTGVGTEKVVVWDSIKGETKVVRMSSIAPIIVGGAITQIPSIGFNPGINLSPTEWINNTFYAFVGASISLSGTTLYEVGTSNTKLLSFSITPKSETIFTSGYINRLTPTPVIPVKSWGSGDSSRSVTVTFNPVQNNPDSLTKTFKACELVGGNGTPETLQSLTVTLSSCYPYFYGMSTKDLSNGGEDFYNEFVLTRVVKVCASSTIVTFSSSDSARYAYFAFPASCNDITIIKDQNSFNWTSAFTKYEKTITGIIWNQVPYKIYRSNNKFITTEPEPWPYTFTQ